MASNRRRPSGILSPSAPDVTGDAHPQTRSAIIVRIDACSVGTVLARPQRVLVVFGPASAALCRALLACGLAVLVAACAPQERPSDPPAPPVAGTPGGTLPRFSASPESPPVPVEDLVRRATEDASRRAGTSGDAVTVVSVEARDWPDRSLGCPQPGMGYAQSITPGYLIILEFAGQRYQYHSDHVQVAYCEAPS